MFFFVRAIFEGVHVVVDHGVEIPSDFKHEIYHSRVIEPGRDVFVACYAVFDSALAAWLVFGMELTEIKSPSFLGVNPSRRSLPSLLWPMLLGWCFYEGYLALNLWAFFGALGLVDHNWHWYPAFEFADGMMGLVWKLMVGTLLCGWTLEVRAIAYWVAANNLVGNLLWCMVVILNAANDEVGT